MIVSGGLPFPAQALGETIPSLTNGYFYAHTGLELANRFATYGALYRAQPSVATVVDKVANAAARLTVKVWDTTPKTGKVLDEKSAFAKLIANPTTEMSPYDFWRWTVSTFEVYGEAFWYKQRGAMGQVVNLLPMHPSRTSVHRSADGSVEYIFTLGVASAGILHAPSSDVVAFQRYNPDSLMRGLSRLEHLRTTLVNEDAARRATSSWWNRGARPSVLLKHPSSLSQAAQDRLKANFDARHAGADNAGGTAVLEEGMDAQVVQLTAEEMQYIESRKMNLQEVCMVFDVPPPVIHILDHATFSNITEQMRSMYRDTMAPRLEAIESVIDFALRSEFFPDGGRIVKFSLDEVLRGDFETRAGAVVQLIQSGVMKPAEARPLFDLTDAGEDADKLYANSALVPLGSAPAKPSAAPGSADAAPLDSEVDPGDSDGSTGDSEDAPKKGLGLKYSPDQERDDHGRFTSGGGSGGSGYSAAVQAAAATVYDRAKAIEPDLTATMLAVAKVNGAEMSGLQYRLKEQDSLERKIDDRAASNGISPEEAANAISDANRYTMVAPAENYTDMANAAISTFQDKGFDCNVKNTWDEGSAYKGINVAMTSPEGAKVELQFHTPESLSVKMDLNHPLYEEARLSSTSPARQEELQAQMIANADALVHPPGVASVGV